MNKVIKICSAILVILLVSVILTNVVTATGIISEINSSIGSTQAQQSVIKTSNKILGVIEVVATAVAILMLMYLSIRYIIASPEGKADYKKTALLYVVGAAIIFIAPKIVKVVMNMTKQVTGKL